MIYCHQLTCLQKGSEFIYIYLYLPIYLFIYLLNYLSFINCTKMFPDFLDVLLLLLCVVRL